MSIDSAQELSRRAQLDEGFQRQLLALPSVRERKAFIHECGYDVGPEDVASLREAAGLQELSEEDLDGVAAGGLATTLGITAGVGGGLGVTAGAAAAAAAAAFGG